MPEIQDYTYKLHKKGDHVVVFQMYRATTGARPRYVQYLNSSGKWYIMRESESGSVRTVEFYLPTDITTIDTDWTGRASLTFSRFDEVF